MNRRKTKPAGGKSKKATRTTANPDFSFIPPVGIYEDERQFTRDGWEQVKR
jgi:hypothetical protein